MKNNFFIIYFLIFTTFFIFIYGNSGENKSIEMFQKNIELENKKKKQTNNLLRRAISLDQINGHILNITRKVTEIKNGIEKNFKDFDQEIGKNKNSNIELNEIMVENLLNLNDEEINLNVEKKTLDDKLIEKLKNIKKEGYILNNDDRNEILIENLKMFSNQKYLEKLEKIEKNIKKIDDEKEEIINEIKINLEKFKENKIKKEWNNLINEVKIIMESQKLDIDENIIRKNIVIKINLFLEEFNKIGKKFIKKDEYKKLNKLIKEKKEDIFKSFNEAINNEKEFSQIIYLSQELIDLPQNERRDKKADFNKIKEKIEKEQINNNNNIILNKNNTFPKIKSKGIITLPKINSTGKLINPEFNFNSKKPKEIKNFFKNKSKFLEKKWDNIYFLTFPLNLIFEKLNEFEDELEKNYKEIIAIGEKSKIKFGEIFKYMKNKIQEVNKLDKFIRNFNELTIISEKEKINLNNFFEENSLTKEENKYNLIIEKYIFNLIKNKELIIYLIYLYEINKEEKKKSIKIGKKIEEIKIKAIQQLKLLIHEDYTEEDIINKELVILDIHFDIEQDKKTLIFKNKVLNIKINL